MGTTQQNATVNGAPALSAEELHEREHSRRLAERYRFPFVDLREQRIDPELFRAIQADLMFRYNFVPLEVHNNVLSIAVAEPSQVALTDELQLLLGKKLSIKSQRLARSAIFSSVPSSRSAFSNRPPKLSLCSRAR